MTFDLRDTRIDTLDSSINLVEPFINEKDNVIFSGQKDESIIVDRISKIPSTRFYGSKRRLIPWIYDSLKNLNFTTVLDGFGGTSSVSLLFKAMGKKVTFNDALISNTISASVLLSNKNPISNYEEFNSFVESVKPYKGFIYKNFKNIYYTDQENAWLDGFMIALNKITNTEKKDLYLYCLFQACLMKRPFNLFHRANLNLRLSREVPRSFGNQATWDTAFIIHINNIYKQYERSVWDSKIKHNVLDPQDITSIDQKFDLIYLDPPYISAKSNGENYLNKYHFLSGLAQYNKWGSLLDLRTKTKKMFDIDYISDWQKRSLFKNKLEQILEKHTASTVVLSYVDNAYPSKYEIEDIFKAKFANVEIKKKDFHHALAKVKKTELLFIGNS